MNLKCFIFLFFILHFQNNFIHLYKYGDLNTNIHDTTKTRVGSPPSSISINLEKNDSVIVDILDANGKFVTEIFRGMLNPGKHSFLVVTKEMTSGIYFVKINVSAKIYFKRIVVLK